MIDISLNNISISFGFKHVLEKFNLEVNTGEKIGLIGPNGCGKTTIFKIITKQEIPNFGDVIIRKNCTIGMLSQIPEKANFDYSVIEILNRNFLDIFEMEKKLRNLESQMASTLNETEMNKILKKYGVLQDKFINAGGYEIKSKVDKICSGFSFDNTFIHKKFNSLSGGEKTKVMFASLLLKEPDILLLDEPTNHLDIKTLEWLEDFLQSYKKTVIISSHDRYFLDKVTNKTVLIERGKAEIFFGNYSYYLEENERRIMKEFTEFKDQQKQINAMKAAIKKLQEFGRLASPGGESFFKRAASIQKRLDKMEILNKPEEKKEIPLNFQMQKRSGKDVLKIEQLTAVIGNKVLLNKANLSIKFGEKICLMGENGSGKSTLIKLILKDYGFDDYNTEAKITEGNITIGTNIVLGYLPQEIKFADETKTILETARNYYDGTETRLRASLAKFLFYGDNVYKKIEKLSGGEKVRLKLFELIQKKANLLILDEPTNHIDIDTKEMLEDALKEYEGTLLFVSHDRYFINKLAEKIENIENKKIVNYIGNYDEYKNVIDRKRKV